MRTGAGSSTSRTWARSRRAAPTPSAFLQRVLSNDVTKIAERRRPVLGALPARTAACSTTSSPTASRRPLPDRHERVQPREGLRLVRSSTPRASTSRSRDVRGRLRDARPPGPGRPRARSRATSRARRRRACASSTARGRRRRLPGLRHGLHGRGRRRAADPAGRRGRGLGRARRRGATPVGPRRARHAAARGLLPPLRQRPVRGPQPDRGRPRLVLQARHGLHRRRRAARTSSPQQTARAVRLHRPGHPAPGQPGARSTARTAGVVTSGTLSPCLEIGIGMAYVPVDAAEPGTHDRGRRARQAAAAPRSARSRSTRRRTPSWPTRAIPTT